MKITTHSEVVQALAERNGISSNVTSEEVRGSVAVIINYIDGDGACSIPISLNAEEQYEYSARALSDLEMCHGKKRENHLLKHREELLGTFYSLVAATCNSVSEPLDIRLQNLAKEIIAILGPVNCIFDLRDGFEKAMILSNEEYSSYLDNICLRDTDMDPDEMDDVDGYYDFGYCREQLITFMLPKASPSGKILQIRLSTDVRRITKEAALDSREAHNDSIGGYNPDSHLNSSVRHGVWRTCENILKRYFADKYLQKDVKHSLERSLLHSVHTLCALYPVENNFVVDLTGSSTRRVELELPPEYAALASPEKWTRVGNDYISGEFRWHRSVPSLSISRDEQ